MKSILNHTKRGAPVCQGGSGSGSTAPHLVHKMMRSASGSPDATAASRVIITQRASNLGSVRCRQCLRSPGWCEQGYARVQMKSKFGGAPGSRAATAKKVCPAACQPSPPQPTSVIERHGKVLSAGQGSQPQQECPNSGSHGWGMPLTLRFCT
jgi:hypothetical protein